MNTQHLKIAYLTAGAAGMFCGSCLNDNALAKELSRLGHDCTLTPVYTPIRTDDEDVSIDRVFMGGINVYLQQNIPLLAYLPRWLDQALNHGPLISRLTKNAGKTSPKLLANLTVSMLKGTRGRLRKEFHRLLDWLEQDVQPDVVVLTNLLIGGAIPDIKRRLSSRVWVTLQGDDIFIDSLPRADRQAVVLAMQQLVPFVDGFIAHSKDYGDRMAELFAIPETKLHIVPLGIDTEPLTKTGLRVPSRAKLPHASTSHPTVGALPQPDPCLPADRFSLGYFARMAPEKGLHRIVDAFIEIATQPKYSHVVLRIAGWMGPQHQEFWQEQQDKLRRAALDGRWEYVGSVDRAGKIEFLSDIDLFCVPTTYAEPKGLFLLEAVASGVPYVQPDHGAFPELHARLHKALSSAQDSPAKTSEIGWLFSSQSPSELVRTLCNAIDSSVARYPLPKDLQTEIDITTHARRVSDLLANQN